MGNETIPFSFETQKLKRRQASWTFSPTTPTIPPFSPLERNLLYVFWGAQPHDTCRLLPVLCVFHPSYIGDENCQE
ncbi:hypothetical protein SLE2022_375790 [Rubroshorea leprosula]